MYQNSIEMIHGGFLGKFNKIKLVQYKNIVNVSVKEPGFASNGYMILDCGKNDLKSERLENTIEFSKQEREMAMELKELIEEKVVEVKNQRVDSAVDNFEKLKKIKELYDLDILSEDEYLDQKERLLEKTNLYVKECLTSPMIHFIGGVDTFFI
ncbi:hypothetical protein KDJ21_015015 [Metabacillus litoralis]|uniref:hypothetical protein n=1 Tax=Metabacillus litoralis TaxID=152268 RepID=UPI001E5C4515|nr:hypothetical protein [Metabacillus litoralis]UHA58174.1 hypothetical protein KDJ21_015015 [Metabacillus litoralis]